MWTTDSKIPTVEIPPTVPKTSTVEIPIVMHQTERIPTVEILITVYETGEVILASEIPSTC